LTGTNTWSGTTNTFSSAIIVPSRTAGDSATNAANTSFVTTAINNLKAGTTWTGTHNFTSATLSAFTQAVGNNSNLVATTNYVLTNATSLVNGLLSSNNTWSGNNNFTTQTLGDNSTLAATTAFVIANSSGSVGGLLGSTNTWTGTSNTFNNKIVTTDIESLSTTRCNLFNNIDTGIIVIGEGWTSGQLYLGTKITGRTGSVQIGCTTCDTVSRGPFKANIGISLQGATNYINCDTNSAAISFFDTLTTGNLNIAKIYQLVM
jgi:hypothetical protein